MAVKMGWPGNHVPERPGVAEAVVWSAALNAGPGQSTWMAPGLSDTMMIVDGVKRRISDVLSMTEAGVEALGRPDAPFHPTQMGRTRRFSPTGQRLEEYKP